MKKDTVLEKIIALAKKDSEVELLWLYGSRAKGNALF